MNIKRTYYIFKCRTHILASHLLERVLKTLSKWGLIVEHKRSYSNIFDSGKPQTAPDIKSKRFVFSVSFIIRKVEFVSQYWFETKRGKRIYTVYDNHHVEHRISYRADLKAFFAHFSHKHRQWVYSHSPKVVIQKVPGICASFIEDEMVKFEYHTCDFSKCRFGFEVSLTPDLFTSEAPRTTEEVISESYRVLGNSLRSKIPEINKTLTGAENDGELTSPSKCPLADNLICRKCGFPVFATPTGRHIYECIHHGEIGHIDIDKVDPRTYEGILANCMSELEYFCECPQD